MDLGFIPELRAYFCFIYWYLKVLAMSTSAARLADDIFDISSFCCRVSDDDYLDTWGGTLL